MSTEKFSREFFQKHGRSGGKKAAGNLTASERSARARKRWYEDCGDCDGCGWVEGGKTIKTTCATCEGTGQVRKK